MLVPSQVIREGFNRIGFWYNTLVITVYLHCHRSAVCRSCNIVFWPASQLT